MSYFCLKNQCISATIPHMTIIEPYRCVYGVKWVLGFHLMFNEDDDRSRLYI